MVEMEVDGKKITAPEGTPVLQAAYDHGIHIPHFCYHKKLSIAASCRMCLVEVENSPRPMPSCAIPVTPGMKVHTHSKLAVEAQKAVLEFLLINHPLDCPICDQGGECKLQDLTMGYGPDTSRFTEEKRVFFVKNVGPLLDLRGMSRCIHCTRCVRFGEEIAGMQELGMMNRGDRSQIMAFVNTTVDSELSGNMIDLCPVGAILSKPFLHQARNWELSSHPSFSPHDSLGSNLVVQSRGAKVLRVLPYENETVNECWISDRDRFSYESLNSEHRLTRPMVKQDGKWIETDWQTALDYVAHGLSSIQRDHGTDAIAALAAPWSTLEEMALLAKIVRGLGSDNVEFRLRQSDFALDGKVVPWLGMPVSEVNQLQGIFLIGSFLRKDQPLLAARVRDAVKNGAQVGVLHAIDDDMLMPLAGKMIAAPSAWLAALGEIVAAIAENKSIAAPAGFEQVESSDEAKNIAASLISGERKSVWLGSAASQHPQASKLHAAAEWIARETGATLGYLPEGGNAIGGYLADAFPAEAEPAFATPRIGSAEGLSERDGMQGARSAATETYHDDRRGSESAASAQANVSEANVKRSGRSQHRTTQQTARAASQAALPKAYLLLHAEPQLDSANPATAKKTLSQAAMVVVMSPFAHGHDYADVMLPIAPFTETAGTFVNMEGKVQSFEGAVLPLGDARPAWKVLRVLGNYLELDGFDYDSSEQVRDEITQGAADVSARLNNLAGLRPDYQPAQASGIERIADVPIYFSDAYVRRANALQHTRDARPPRAHLALDLAERLGIADGDMVRVCQSEGETLLPALIDRNLPQNVVRVAAAHELTAKLGPMFGSISVEKA